jgi:DNA-binding LytR/AlgR family response regulator
MIGLVHPRWSRFGGPKDLTVLAWTCAGALTLTLLATLQGGAEFANRGEAIPWLGILLARTVNCFAYALFMPLLWRLTQNRPLNTAPLVQSLALYVAVSLAIALAKETIFVAIGNLFRPGVFVLRQILSEDYLDEVLTVWALIALCHAFAFYRARTLLTGASSLPKEAYLSFQADGAFHRVRLADIERAEAQGNYVEISTPSGRWLTRETMSRLEARLGAGFVRVHRSHIVNPDKVVRLESRSHSEYWVVLASGERAPTSRQYKHAVRQRLLTPASPDSASSQAQSNPSQPR